MENARDKDLFAALTGPLRAFDVTGVQVNLGRLCNQSCSHCHLEASPSRREVMGWAVMKETLKALAGSGIQKIELTGGAAELNPYFRPFVTELQRLDLRLKVRTNLTVLLEPGLEGLASFLRNREIHLSASLPCYEEFNVEAQRGKGVFAKSIAALQLLNKLGYGTKSGPELEIVFNPQGPFLPAGQGKLEERYKKNLKTQYGITFTRLLVLTNMPVGRFYANLKQEEKDQEYLALLYRSFNKHILEKLMCRSSVSIDWDGTLYDCDFNLALGTPMAGEVTRVGDFHRGSLSKREITTGKHCLGCTAGAGSSCQGMLEVDHP